MGIENTSERDPLIHLGGMMGGVTPYIEGQERAGQAQLVNSTQLPRSMRPDRAAFEALGITFGEERDLFVEATLPDGWTREGSDHAMHSYVLDAEGYRRIGVFYKAAFYDRRADMSIISVPQTTAQADAYQAVFDMVGYGGAQDHDQPSWNHGADRREGADYVHRFTGCKGLIAAERDGDRYSHGGVNGYVDDGRRIEITVAPDGTIKGTREWTEDPA